MNLLQDLSARVAKRLYTPSPNEWENDTTELWEVVDCILDFLIEKEKSE